MTKILLVEDDKSLREIYGVRLLAEGYDIVSAGDGEEALAMVVKEMPDLILSDVMMPRVSGFDMLDILRANPPTRGIKVIMMTALSSEDQRQRGEQLGANKYLVKSQVGIEDVVKAVHEVLGDLQTPVENPSVNNDSLEQDIQSSSVAFPDIPASNSGRPVINQQPQQQFRTPPAFARETPSLQPMQRIAQPNNLQSQVSTQNLVSGQPQVTQPLYNNSINNTPTPAFQPASRTMTEPSPVVNERVVQPPVQTADFESQEAQFAAELDSVLKSVSPQAVEIPTQPEQVSPSPQPPFGAR